VVGGGGADSILRFRLERGGDEMKQGRVAGGGGVDSILRFRLERGGDETKRCWKMKQS
jgi:hypothetical protein